MCLDYCCFTVLPSEREDILTDYIPPTVTATYSQIASRKVMDQKRWLVPRFIFLVRIKQKKLKC